MKSAYVDKVRISWVLDTNEDGDPNQGLMFVASHDQNLDSATPANNDGNIIAASATRGAAGVVTLDIKRRITMNYDGSDVQVRALLEGSSGAPLWLHAYKSNTGTGSNYLLVIETYGRWFKAESL